MDDGQITHETTGVCPGYAEGKICLPGQKSEEIQGEKSKEKEINPGDLFASCREVCMRLLPAVESDPKTYVAFRSMMQLIDFINDRVCWRAV